MPPRSLLLRNRGPYSSERKLREFLTDAGIAFSWGDLAPALALLEAAGKITRPGAALGMPRGGQLSTEQDHAPEPREMVLAKVVLAAVRPGSDGLPVTEAELRERLVEADVDIERLSDVIERLLDCNRLLQVRRGQGDPIRLSRAVTTRWTRWIGSPPTSVLSCGAMVINTRMRPVS
jgi:hypothetical protein